MGLAPSAAAAAAAELPQPLALTLAAVGDGAVVAGQPLRRSTCSLCQQMKAT
jgi:hypothetical protein